MNKYFDYLVKRFGGAQLSGLMIISEILEKYDISNVNKAYADYGEDHNMTRASVERAIRHYITVIGNTTNIEKTLKCKCFNGTHFSNKEFLRIVKVRAEEEKHAN